MTKIFANFVPILLLATIIYVFRAPLWVFSHQALRQVAPCTVPIPYAIGTIDPRFDVSGEYIEKAAEEAIAVWEHAAGRDLFVLTSSGTPVVTLNFEYDLRQKTTERLKHLGAEISSDSAEYDALERDYNSLRSRYQQAKAAFESAAAAFDLAARTYEQEVESWNERGGAPKSVVDRLNEEKAALHAKQQTLSAQQVQVNNLADQVNEFANRLNSIARDLNTTAQTYNTVGAQTGEEFEEGVYESRAGKETITVFEFDSRARLVRLLAHEFGHALGLDHVDGGSSIMYRLNQGSSVDPSDADIDALVEQCSL